jgi:UMF1 family MFS transporter
MDRRAVRSWCLYDFGNSAFAILFPAFFSVYFARVVVGAGNPRADLYWGWAVSASMLLVALSAPFLGGIADHAGVRKRMLASLTGIGVLAVLGFALLGPGMVVRGFLVAVLANFAFEGGIVFYNSYLPVLAPPEWQGRISARGFAVGYAGSLVALGFGAVLADRIELVWIALALQWALFALPGLKFLPPDVRTGASVVEAGRRGFAATFATLREVLSMRDLRRFLLAYFFYEDGVNTVIHFAARYADQTLRFTTRESVAMLALVQGTALLGALLLARPTDRKGPKWAIELLLFWWTGVVIAAFFAREKTVFFVVAGLAGLGLGSIQAASRAMMSRLIPPGREAEMFGFYALCGRTGAILGPTMFGAISSLAGDQRPAILAVALLYAVGYLMLRRVRG